MFPNDEVVAYGRANGLGSDYNDIMTAFLRDYYSSNLSLTDLWGRAWAEGYRSINGFTDFPGIANSEFYAPLTHSLVLTRGTGSATFTRATKAWEFGYSAAANAGADQVLIEVATGTPRFGGARYDAGTWYNTYADGSAISASSLLGYHAEGARTNSLRYSRDLTKYAWYGSETGSELVTNGQFGTDASGWTTYAGSSVAASGGVLVLTSAGAGARTDTAITTVVGRVYTGKATATAKDGGSSSIRVGTSNNGASQNLTDTALTVGTQFLFSFVATATTTYICLLTTQTSGTASFDNISVKESSIQVTTCTGIDNAANSASTLTAGAADATILQTLSLAAAARSFSAYVKRRTGSGNIYITRDGGTSWTDVTSQINSSAWTRVKIENTSVLNPSCGFKIATSGDAIDVDVCQDEAGAFISSPIVTTSAAVTRNEDTLNYPKASNLNNTAGTALLSWSISQTGATVSGTQVPLLIDANGSLAYTYSGAGFDIARSYDGTAVAESSGLSRKSTSRKQATNWTGATQKTITEGAAAVDSDTYDGTWGAGSTIQIGQMDAFFGYVRNAYIWSTALTDEQLQQVTS